MRYINTKKLYKIKLNKDNSYVLIDFDRTITNGDSFSAWRVLYYSDLLGDNFKKEYDKIHDNTKPDKNTSIEFKVLSYEKRFKQFMKLLENCNYSESINKQAVYETKIELRDGAKEFFKTMHELSIPVIVLSSSIGNVIKDYLKITGCYYDNISIYSNYYDYSSHKNHICNVTPYNKDKIIFSDKTNDIIKNRKYILLLGDLIADISMVLHEKLENTITVGFLDKDIEKNLEEYNSNFDFVLTNNSSFEDVINLINY